MKVKAAQEKKEKVLKVKAAQKEKEKSEKGKGKEKEPEVEKVPKKRVLRIAPEEEEVEPPPKRRATPKPSAKKPLGQKAFTFDQMSGQHFESKRKR